MMHQIILHDFTYGGRKVAPHNGTAGVLRGASFHSKAFCMTTIYILFSTDVESTRS